ncbi:hypothetical membrane protein [Renibacterium salmoninarum ATCC 33209]|uniref:Hypothetical membrane protein n=1 Tax=Renibacterium salmoninarum (strain ATCC 33209 / DSM 20767 / JCM 11484 / NBRC 15589 / NCIMB 2235) TaxID=288705 RepID=A9WT50_RENSM|nr:hypothetical protein [Renibacterium salmoninarum]ABY23988.1 hypothetical membrane protein [Renibacterium salmoninarum ATCC 33209]
MKIHHLSRARSVATIAVLLSLGLSLAACSDPGNSSKTETTAAALTPVAQAASAEPIRAQLNQAAADQLPAELRARGKLTVANAVGAVPLGFLPPITKLSLARSPQLRKR